MYKERRTHNLALNKDSSFINFDKILDQNSYIPDNVAEFDKIKCNLSSGDNVPRVRTWSRSTENGLVKRIWPMILFIGLLETIVGVGLLILLVMFTSEYDTLFSTTDSKVISLTSFGGLITLVVSGVMLVISLLVEKRRVMWFHILTAMFLCVYIFVLSVMKIHFALLILEQDTYSMTSSNRHFFLSTACAVGIDTLLGSVIHFVGNVTVLTYYNLKYVHPAMFSCGP